MEMKLNKKLAQLLAARAVLSKVIKRGLADKLLSQKIA
jgi:hypothetical protein